MKKRLKKKSDKQEAKIYVNDKRFFKPDNMSPGWVVAYAVYVPGEKEKVGA